MTAFQLPIVLKSGEHSEYCKCAACSGNYVTTALKPTMRNGYLEFVSTEAVKHELYDCGICGCNHRTDWDGDCREDANRYDGYDDYAERNRVDVDDVEVITWEEMLERDAA